MFNFLPDVAGILLAALSLSLIFLPNELKVLEHHRWKWLRWALAGVFAAVGLGGLISNAIQKNEDKQERQKLDEKVAQLNDKLVEVTKKLTDNQRPTVGLARLSFWPNQELLPDKDIAVQIAYVVKEGEATNYRWFPEIFSLPGKQSAAMDRAAMEKFRRDSFGKFDNQGPTATVGTGSQITLHVKFNKVEASQILANRRSIYIVGRIEWNNRAGADFHLDTCLYLETPPASKHLNDLGWHFCRL